MIFTVILDDERKNLQSKPKKKKGKTTEAPSKVLKKTTPNEFFGSNKSTKISKPVNKRKANDLEANKTKKPKHVSSVFIFNKNSTIRFYSVFVYNRI